MVTTYSKYIHRPGTRFNHDHAAIVGVWFVSSKHKKNMGGSWRAETCCSAALSYRQWMVIGPLLSIIHFPKTSTLPLCQFMLDIKVIFTLYFKKLFKMKLKFVCYLNTVNFSCRLQCSLSHYLHLLPVGIFFTLQEK